MSDPYIDAVARFSEAIDRLKLELSQDSREIAERIAKLETLPRSIDELRVDIKALEEKSVTSDDVKGIVNFALLQHQNDELKRGRKSTHDSQSISIGPQTKFRLEDRKDSRAFWAKVIAIVVGAVITLATLYNTASIKRMESTQESKEAKPQK